jgi:hypothetical protein
MKASSSAPHVKNFRSAKPGKLGRTFVRGLTSFMNVVIASTFKCISWLNGLFFGGEHGGFLKEKVKTYQMAPVLSLNSPLLFLPAHL